MTALPTAYLEDKRVLPSSSSDSRAPGVLREGGSRPLFPPMLCVTSGSSFQFHAGLSSRCHPQMVRRMSENGQKASRLSKFDHVLASPKSLISIVAVTGAGNQQEELRKCHDSQIPNIPKSAGQKDNRIDNGIATQFDNRG